jgi:hypothetical protein
MLYTAGTSATLSVFSVAAILLNIDLHASCSPAEVDFKAPPLTNTLLLMNAKFYLSWLLLSLMGYTAFAQAGH